MGVRVHKLAKELNRSSKELLDILRGQGIDLKNHFASVDESTAAKLRIQFGGEDSIRDSDEDASQEESPVETVKTPEPEEKAPEKKAPAAKAEPAPEAEPAEEPAKAEAPEAATKDADDEGAPESAPDSDAADSDAADSDDGGSDADGSDDAGAEAPAAKDESSDAPKAPPRKIVMAPGFGGAAPGSKQPVKPVARPMPAGGPQSKPRKGRPLIIRSKAPAPAPARRGPGAGAPGRGPAGPGRGPGGPGGPGRGPGGPGRGPGGPGGTGGGPPSKVRFFPGDGGMLPGTGAPPGRGRGGRGGGRRSGKTHRGAHGRGRQRESLDHFRRQRQEEVLSGEKPSEITVQMPVTLKELSPLISVRQNFLLKALMEDGVLINVNSALTEEMLLVIGEKFSIDIDVEEAKAVDSTLAELEKLDPDENLVPRAPVVTILGHVDHGKTSLLDKIRETHVTQSESGGITQHISAYRVDHENKHVVFIDTPGHKAFTEMRARGANVTDVAVLVVAADDGPMPQTIEAKEHAEAADVPIVVAINKIDRPNANVEMTKTKLAEIGLSPPEWGGKTEMVEVSAITGQGIDALLEILSLETEVLELRANPDKNAIGTVLEAKATTGRGNVVTMIVLDGTLRNGDTAICGAAHGKIRTMTSTTGVPLDEAGPATPVEITGLTDLPEAGDRFYVLDDISEARDIAEDRKRKKRAAERMVRQHVTLEGLFDKISEGETKEIKLVVKADMKGSMEVLRKELTDIGTSEVGVRLIRSGVGEITEDDVLLADASDAIIIGFHVSANPRARSQAEEKGVEIRTYQVIYQVIEEMRLALEGMLDPEILEEVQGSVEILQLFRSSRLGNIAGCIVRSGRIRREDPVRLIRDGRMIYEGKIDSLKRVKEDVREVKEGFECGLRIQGYDDIKIGDFVESFRKVEKARTLDESSAGSS